MPKTNFKNPTLNEEDLDYVIELNTKTMSILYKLSNIYESLCVELYSNHRQYGSLFNDGYSSELCSFEDNVDFIKYKNLVLDSVEIANFMKRENYIIDYHEKTWKKSLKSKNDFFDKYALKLFEYCNNRLIASKINNRDKEVLEMIKSCMSVSALEKLSLILSDGNAVINDK